MQARPAPAAVGLPAPALGGRLHGARSASTTVRAAPPGRERKGFFGDVDPKAEVYPVKSGLSGDITKRSKSRWESDFIWNKDWAKQLDYEESLRRQQEEGQKWGQGGGTGGAAAGASTAGLPTVRGGQPQKGFLSLTSKVDLDSLDVDLSEQLRARRGSGGQASGSGAAGAGKAAPRRRPQPKFGSVPPTRVEQRSWERGGKYSRKVVAVAPTNEADQDALAQKLAAENARYDELKAELQAWAAGLTLVCFAATFAFYGRDVAASYGLGALGGLLYLRLLNRSIDGFGSLGGAAGQPRLLIPVILALGYNRYNTLVAEEIGLTLQLLPMLLGFFTYKGAVVGKQSLVLFGELTSAARGGAGGGGGEGGGEGVAAENGGGTAESDVASVDRAFTKRVLNEM